MCHGTGVVEAHGCPRKLIPASVWELIDAAEFAQKGHWPLPGGWMDQTTSCLQGVRRVWAEYDAAARKAKDKRNG